MNYEYRCRDCGSTEDKDFEGGLAPEVYDDECPKCNKETRWQRWYSFGVGSGASSGSRPS
jgi:hypothetical protein